jgi:hypothetical protein
MGDERAQSVNMLTTYGPENVCISQYKSGEHRLLYSLGFR